MKRSMRSFVAVATVAALYGCGGSSTPSIPELSGTVATGKAVAVGTKVTVKDAKDVVRTTTTDANGLYRVSVGDLTPPFVICVDTTTPPLAVTCANGTGTSDKVLMSVANQAGTANITPLTKLAAASAAGVTDPTSIFNTLATLKALTNDKITQGLNVVTTMVRDYLKTAGIDPTQFNPLTTPFTANSKGVDSVLDQVKPSLGAGGAVTITFPNATGGQLPVSIPDITKFAQYSSTVRTGMKGAWSNVATKIAPLAGGTITIPDHVTLPTGLTIPPGVTIPSSVTLPTNFAVPTGVILASGITLPSGIDLSKMTTSMPSGVTIPSTATLPATWKTSPPVGVTIPTGAQFAAPTTTTTTPTTPTTTTPTTTTPTTTTPSIPTSASSSISIGSAKGYTCVTAPFPANRCSYITTCASSSGSGYYQSNLGTFSFSSTAGIQAAAQAVVYGCM